MTKERPN